MRQSRGSAHPEISSATDETRIGRVERLVGLMTGRATRWVIVLLWLALALVATPLASRLGDAQTNDAAAFLPPNAESTKVLTAQRNLPGGDAIPAVVVFARADGPLTARLPRSRPRRSDSRRSGPPSSPHRSLPLTGGPRC